jgi:hypothetical protein
MMFCPSRDADGFKHQSPLYALAAISGLSNVFFAHAWIIHIAFARSDG